jgi:hypothetical protein
LYQNGSRNYRRSYFSQRFQKFCLNKDFHFTRFRGFRASIGIFSSASFCRGEIALGNSLNVVDAPSWRSRSLGQSVSFVFHLFVGRPGMYSLARQWIGSNFAVVAGVAFAFNRLTLNFPLWTHNTATLGWMRRRQAC